jgi:DNA-binding LytR/AlgR family response regulator
MIRVIAIDDEPLALQQLVGYIKKIPFFELAAQCQSALEAREYMNREPVDAIFCDINMPDLSGMEFVKQLPVKPIIVFTTAYSEYAIEGYKVDAVDYLLKPFGFSDFQRAAMKVQKNFSANNLSSIHDVPLGNLSQNGEGSGDNDSFFVKTDYRTIRVSISDIRYVEGMSEYLKLHLESQPKPIITLLSMKSIEEFLPQNFMRIHRSYIVNLDKVQEVNKNRIVMDADTFLPIGDNYREQFNNYLSTHFLGKKASL